MTINRKSINKFLIYAFVFVTTLMPAESFNMKELFLGLILITNIDTILNGFSKCVLGFGVLLPCWLLLISIIAGGNIVDSIRSVYIFTFIWIPVIALKYGIDLKRIFLNVTFYIAILIDAFVFLHATGLMPLQSNPLAMWLGESGNAQLSYGSVAIFYYVFFLNACPLLLFTLVDAMQNGNKIRIIMVIFALMFSGTRANIYIGVVTVIAYLIVYKRNDWKKHLLIVGGGLLSIFVLICLAPTMVKKIQTINSVKTFGDEVRAGRTVAAVGEIFGNTKVFFIGMGANVPFSANGILNYSAEMSYIEVWRIYGVISFIAIVAMLVYLLWKNRKDAATIAYVGYLAICAVDPFLMTSTGFLMVMFMFYLFMSSAEMSAVASEERHKVLKPLLPRVRLRIH